MNAKELEGLEVTGAPSLRIASSVTLVSRGGKDCEFKGNAAVVLAWLALEGRADRRRLAALLWPASEAGQARSNLRVLTCRINQRFGGELVVGTEHLELDASQAQVDLHDVEVVLAALAAGGAARCELLAEAGLETHSGEQLQAWLEGARRRLKRLYLVRLSEALTEAIALGWRERAAALARACVQLDPLSEHRHRRLMEVLFSGGDRAAALAAYEECKEVLKQHLGVLPDLQTRTLHLNILQEQALGSTLGRQQAPPADDLTALRGAARYPLVEREAVLSHAQAALKQGVHVVVHGEPGVGKTRLLRHLAAGAGSQMEPVALRSALRQEPYAAVAQLLQEVQARRKPRIGMPEQIELGRLAPSAFAGVKPSEAALSAPRLHAALRHWFARLGDVGVRVLLLDDVQYADAASQAAFASLLESTPEAGETTPTLLLAHRSAEIEAVLDEAVMQAKTRHQARRVELPRLTLAGVQTLLAAMEAAPRLGEPEALARELHKRTGGNPLFVIELARQALDPSEAADMCDLRALLACSLKRCGAMALQLAAVAAVAAEDFTVELAAAVTDQTALALMPPWLELQQRGLFAGHGLAHDLVQDAVLAGLPQAILQLLHRQVGQYLESQGRQGLAVLRHWTAANDADRALPHAVHQLYAVTAAGLPTMQQELDILGLLERASAPALMANLWLTGELDNSMGNSQPVETWHRVRGLVQRVQSLSGPAAPLAWTAYETARCSWSIDRSPKAAYEVLAPAAEQMPQQGIERAFVENELALLAIDLTGDPRMHLQRARHAVAGLQQPAINRVRMQIDDMACMFLDPVEGIRAQVTRWRAGRRRGDLATVADACMRMGQLHAIVGTASQSLRCYARAARLHPGNGQGSERFQTAFRVGKVALNAGDYALAHQLMSTSDEALAQQQRSVFLAVLALRIGDLRQAEVHVGEIAPESRQYYSAQIAYAYTRAVLTRLEGRDPAPALQRQLELAQAFGLQGINLDLMAWEVVLHTQPVAERLDRADALLCELRHSGTGGGRLAKALLEIAEVRAEVHAPQVEPLVAEASRLLRRGYTITTLYLPEGLLRCARLIRHRDPREADALVHVAQRWVCHALKRLPPDAEEGFVRNVATNRLLLGADKHALHTAPLC